MSRPVESARSSGLPAWRQAGQDTGGCPTGLPGLPDVEKGLIAMPLPVSRSSRQSAMMPTRQRDSVREMEDVYDEMQGVYDRMGQLMRGVFGTMAPTSLLTRMPSSWQVPADIEETEDAIIVELELPGVRSGDVDVELRGNHLLVSGEIRERENRGILRRQARNIGRFEHVVLLPCDINQDKVEASLADGVMTIRMGKAKTEKSRHIPVKGS